MALPYRRILRQKVIVRINKAIRARYLQYERENYKVLFMLHVVPSAHGCAYATKWAKSERWWGPAGSFSDNGIVSHSERPSNVCNWFCFFRLPQTLSHYQSNCRNVRGICFLVLIWLLVYLATVFNCIGSNGMMTAKNWLKEWDRKLPWPRSTLRYYPGILAAEVEVHVRISGSCLVNACLSVKIFVSGFSLKTNVMLIEY
jgi:hypothetical protein